MRYPDAAALPDPHGNCLIQDTNNTSGHGEWRDGGEAVATNVPAWAQPVSGWPTDYQTAVGAVPEILGLPFANVTPDQVSRRELYQRQSAILRSVRRSLGL